MDVDNANTNASKGSNKENRVKHSPDSLMTVDDNDDSDKLHKAATKIQSTFRGYKTRKHITKTKPAKNAALSENKNNSSPNNSSSRRGASNSSSNRNQKNKINQEQAAVKIQSTFRGYKTRKQLEHIKSKNSS
jgi:hypothetical protein